MPVRGRLAKWVSRRTVYTMETLGAGLITLANGVLDMSGRVLSPVVFVFALLIVSLGWLCLIELDELDRQGSKPEIGRH